MNRQTSLPTLHSDLFCCHGALPDSRLQFLRCLARSEVEAAVVQTGYVTLNSAGLPVLKIFSDKSQLLCNSGGVEEEPGRQQGSGHRLPITLHPGVSEPRRSWRLQGPQHIVPPGTPLRLCDPRIVVSPPCASFLFIELVCRACILPDGGLITVYTTRTALHGPGRPAYISALTHPLFKKARCRKEFAPDKEVGCIGYTSLIHSFFLVYRSQCIYNLCPFRRVIENKVDMARHKIGTGLNHTANAFAKPPCFRY